MKKTYLIIPLVVLAVVSLARVVSEPARQTDPIQVAPHNYKVVFENDRVRVLSFHGRPGDKWALHSHPDSVVVSLSDYQVRNVVPGSEPKVREARHGDVLWIPARMHTGENVGSTDMDCVLVELKEAKR